MWQINVARPSKPLSRIEEKRSKSNDPYFRRQYIEQIWIVLFRSHTQKGWAVNWAFLSDALIEDNPEQSRRRFIKKINANLSKDKVPFDEIIRTEEAIGKKEKFEED